MAPYRLVSLVCIGAACVAAAGCAGTTDPASDVTPTAATLNARGRTDSTPGHFEFQYAANPAWLGTPDGFVTPTIGPFPPHVPPGGGLAAFVQHVKGLRPSTTYSYRVCGGDGQVHPDACAGTRTFTTPAGAPVVDFATSTPLDRLYGYATAMVAADLDRDGNVDLAVAGNGGVPDPGFGPLLIFGNDGRGTFGPPVSVGLPAGFDGAGLAAGDFTNDGKADIVAGGSAGIVLMKGDGNGGLAQGAQTALDARPTQLVAADVNRDGKLDVVMRTGDPDVGEESHVIVALGNGQGAFAPSADIDAAQRPAAVAVRDVDHDGIRDLLLATRNPVGVSVLLGNGSGGFAAPRNVPLPSGAPSDLVTGDVDRDGNADAVVPGWLLRGDGHGGLGSPVAIPNSPTDGLALADFDGDGRLDLAGQAQRLSDAVDQRMVVSIDVLPGNGDGSFQTPNSFPCGGYCEFFEQAGSYFQSIAADLFHDGRPSLVSLGEFGTGSGGIAKVTVQRNTTAHPPSPPAAR
jgi:VCBS repeat protein